MGFLSSLRPPARSRRRGAAFPGADIGRLTSSWTTDPGAINRWLRYELRTLRARSRMLARGDAYGARFIKACVDNIAGPKPFRLQSKVKFKSDGTFNTTANDRIEEVWREAGLPGVYEVTGKMSRAAFHRLKVRCLARDGEVLTRKHFKRSWPDGGKGYRMQLLDIDRLDEQFNDTLSGGRTVKMGVELDRFSRPVAYHLLKEHPGEMGEWNRGMARDHERVPAEQIRHLFVPDWPEQVRGFPWMHAAMVRLWHLGAFEEAAVINARIGAAKIAAIQSPEGDPPPAMVTGQEPSSNGVKGNLLTDVEPGTYWQLPEGYSLESFMPQFPDASVDTFIKACLRGASAAVGMAYHSFANDPGEVNYSTARVALLDERDGWSATQQWYIEHDCEPEGLEWLLAATEMGTLPENYWAYRNDQHYQPKRWQWIDPQKEAAGKETALKAKITSRTRIAAENGEDIEEIFDELAAEEQMAKDKGLKLDAAPQGNTNGPQQPAQQEDDSGSGNAGSGAQE